MEEAQTIISSLSALSYGGIFILFLLANAVIPFPEEVFIIALGYLGSLGTLNMFIAAPIAIAGLIISDIIIFTLIKRGNKFLMGIGKMILYDDDFTAHSDFFRNHIRKIIFFSRFVAGFRFIGPFTAGMLKIKTKTFILLDSLAIIILVPSLMFVGNYFQNKFVSIVNTSGIIKHWMFFLIIIIVFLILGRHLRRLVLKTFFPHKHK
ncbi:hypothetical protein COB64_03090 [Candidatus Wolfebacteria bacterium]|nr:MAG: hypothetical protein COB64_03090 [Candidatus Wolfebacteria bacterium]